MEVRITKLNSLISLQQEGYLEAQVTKDSHLVAREVAYSEIVELTLEVAYSTILELPLAVLVEMASSETIINRTQAQQVEVSLETILKIMLNLQVHLEVAQLQALQLHLLEELEEVFLVTTKHRLTKILG